MKNKKVNFIAIAAVILVTGVAGFFAGMQYQKSSMPSQQAQFQMFRNSGNQGGMMGGQNRMGGTRNTPVSGEVISVDETGITVKMQDGSSKIVIVSDKTTVNKSSTATKADIKVGEKVTTFGSTNTDGSITAQIVSLGNAMMFRGAAPAQK